MGAAEFDLESLLEVRDLSRQAIEERFELSADDVEHGVRYEAATGLDLLANEASAPARFYFRGPDLVMLYVDGSSLEHPSAKAVVAKLGEPTATLRSRAGKASTLYLYPSRGFAYSACGDAFDFIEVFHPTTLERYQREIYQDPGHFVR
ncbi:MAG: hypothetical protein M0Z42_22635 [Actinomycetota bacterium]|nr:hypothetical protein [Actinomycetota bacterium]